MNILFVCSGNVSRSFMAERLLGHETARLNLSNVSVSSAGLFAYPGNAADPRMVEYLSERAISTQGHEARQITEADVDWADMILVMEREHEREIGRLWPNAQEKVACLGKYISNGQEIDNIMDPFGQSAYHYRLAQSQITLAVKAFVQKVLLKQSKPARP